MQIRSLQSRAANVELSSPVSRKRRHRRLDGVDIGSPCTRAQANEIAKSTAQKKRAGSPSPDGFRCRERHFKITEKKYIMSWITNQCHDFARGTQESENRDLGALDSRPEVCLFSLPLVCCVFVCQSVRPSVFAPKFGPRRRRSRTRT